MKSKKQLGFTIVELLIVIVVIGILAAIVIVAFNGVQNRAKDTSIQTDLKNIAGLLEQHRAVHESYPSSLMVPALKSFGTVSVSKDAYGNHFHNGTGYYNLLYCRSTSSIDFALIAASASGKVFQYSSTGGGVKEHSHSLASSSQACGRAGIPDFGAWWAYRAGEWDTGI